MIFTLIGRVKPAVRMTQRGKFTSPQAAEYLACKHALGLQLRHQMARHEWDMLPGQTPLRVWMHFEFPGGMNNMDLDNLIKSMIDSANNIAYPDDRWINKIEASRATGSEYRTTFEVEVLK
jgi:Holliday junction resolvase RusA-like endonuclease